MRIEEDCIGKLELEDNVLYGIHSKRAVSNFPISAERVHTLIIESLLQIKKAASQANYAAGTLSAVKARAINEACYELLQGKNAEAFIVPAIQGGAGTSSNMSVNEVIAHLANQRTHKQLIHPNDDVNQAQSTNDTFPTAGKMAMLKLLPGLLSALTDMIEVMLKKAFEFSNTLKVARTQLQDAVPTTLGRSFHAYYALFKRDLKRIEHAAQGLNYVNLGGTAIGTGINASELYQQKIVPLLNRETDLQLQLAPDLIDATQNCDVFVEFSGALKSLAVDLSKTSNDLRMLASGPRAGFNEISLPKKQAGSSIMPGKINPVIPEVVNQVAFEVMGNDVTVTLAAEAGQLELNAFEPIIFKRLLESEEHLTGAIKTLTSNCLNGLKANEEKCAADIENSIAAATVLTPYLGYEKTTRLVKEAIAKNISVKEILKANKLLSQCKIKELFSKEKLIHQHSSEKIGNLV
ncbi:aspartate ammonia-lyase [Liquorilactobacillus capillatus]|nr:aspartate ammonia-lyase [Liquorilactobacillus capillatus]